MIPQVIVLAMMFVMLLKDSYRHGKKREVTENIFASLIAVALNLGLLYWGGFFDVFFKH